jgi:hypothetical protein
VTPSGGGGGCDIDNNCRGGDVCCGYDSDVMVVGV